MSTCPACGDEVTEKLVPVDGPILLGEGSAAHTCQARTWSVTFPAGMELLSANDRGHWSRRSRITAELRRTAGWLAKQQHIPPLGRARIVAFYNPPDRRKRDPGNLYPSFKACIDGFVDAGVLSDDDAKHLDGPDPRLGPVCPGGRLVLRITELAPQVSA